MNQKNAKLIFMLSIIFFVVFGSFAYGLVVGTYKVWPYDFINRMKQVIVSLYATSTISPVNRLHPAPPDASRVRIRMTSELMPGFLAIMGYDNKNNQFAIWLFDEKGSEVYQWPINYTRIDPDGPSHNSDAPHGLSVMPDGSVMVGFDKGDAMARLDLCGQPVWIKKGIFHHVMSPTKDGSFWIWEAEDHPNGHYHYLIKVDSETGHTIKKISLKDDVILKNQENALTFSIPPDFEFRRFDGDPGAVGQDIFHPNDVEELSEEMAIHFPQFNPGDLLISLRHLHLVAVLDSESNDVKWARHGPWRFQHDPDFIENGTISIYDNNKGMERSKIIEVDPLTNKIWYRFPDADFSFNNSSMGTHQRLPNGGELISVAMEGRVLVANPDGKLVFEYNNIVSEELNASIQNAVWLPSDFFDIPLACK